MKNQNETDDWMRAQTNENYKTFNLTALTTTEYKKINLMAELKRNKRNISQ
jgi:hypothetical protein